MTSAIIGLIGVIIGSVLAALREFFLSARERRKDAEYAAIRIVCVLDEYLDKCLAVVCDDGTSEGRPAGRTDQGEEFHVPTVPLPKPPKYPDDINWKSIRTALMYGALALPNKARDTDQYIKASAEHAFPPDYEEIFEAQQVGYARLGLEAHRMASELRKLYGIAPKDDGQPISDWNSVSFLKHKIKEIEARRLKQAESQKAMFDGICSRTGASS